MGMISGRPSMAMAEWFDHGENPDTHSTQKEGLPCSPSRFIFGGGPALGGFPLP